jgi:translation elongation factor EF-1alpha
MIVGASQADAALFVISARPGEFEAAIGPQGQGRSTSSSSEPSAFSNWSSR